jgi:hypothetical protein
MRRVLPLPPLSESPSVARMYELWSARVHTSPEAFPAHARAPAAHAEARLVVCAALGRDFPATRTSSARRGCVHSLAHSRRTALSDISRSSTYSRVPVRTRARSSPKREHQRRGICWRVTLALIFREACVLPLRESSASPE